MKLTGTLVAGGPFKAIYHRPSPQRSSNRQRNCNFPLPANTPAPPLWAPAGPAYDWEQTPHSPAVTLPRASMGAKGSQQPVNTDGAGAEREKPPTHQDGAGGGVDPIKKNLKTSYPRGRGYGAPLSGVN